MATRVEWLEWVESAFWLESHFLTRVWLKLPLKSAILKQISSRFGCNINKKHFVGIEAINLHFVGTQEVNPHQLKWKLRLKSLVHGWACSQFVCQILNLQLLWQFTFFWWIGSLFPIRLVWLISQSNLNGFCFNMAHVEAILEVALWLELTQVD